VFASVYVLTFLFRGAGVVAPEASALAVAACASRTLFAVVAVRPTWTSAHELRHQPIHCAK
jgi:hypothetical protein